jgi:hypothetical protein
MYSPGLHVPDLEQRESVSKGGFQSCRQASRVKTTSPEEPEDETLETQAWKPRELYRSHHDVLFGCKRWKI